MKHIFSVSLLLTAILWCASSWSADITSVDTQYYKSTKWVGSSAKYRDVVLTMNDDLTFKYTLTVCPDKEDLAGKECIGSGLEKKVEKSGTGWNVLIDQLGSDNKTGDDNSVGQFLVSNMKDSPRLLIVNKMDATTGVESLPELHYGELILKLETSRK